MHETLRILIKRIEVIKSYSDEKEIKFLLFSRLIVKACDRKLDHKLYFISSSSSRKIIVI